MSREVVVDALRNHGIKLIGNRPHAPAELRQKLVRLCTRRQRNLKHRERELFLAAGSCEELAEEAVGTLEAQHLVSDRDFAEWFVRQRSEFRPRSRIVLSAELRQRGVATDVVQRWADDYDEDRACYRQLLRAQRKYSDPAKLVGFLARKGFAYPVIRRAMDRQRDENLKTER